MSIYMGSYDGLERWYYRDTTSGNSFFSIGNSLTSKVMFSLLAKGYNN